MPRPLGTRDTRLRTRQLDASVLVALALAVSSPALAWQTIVDDGECGSSARDLVVLPDGDAVAVGGLRAAEGDFLVARFRGADGEELWRTPLPGSGHAVALSPDGNVIAVDSHQVVKLSADDGRLIWRNRVLGGFDVTATADGDVIAALYDDSLSFSVARLSGSDGRQLWRFDSRDLGVVERVIVDSAGNVIAGGLIHFRGDFYGDLAVVKLDGSDGSEAWRFVVTGKDQGQSKVNDLALDSSDEVLVAGTVASEETGNDFAVFKLSGADGSELWRDVRDGGAPGEAAHAVIPQGTDFLRAAGSFEGRFASFSARFPNPGGFRLEDVGAAEAIRRDSRANLFLAGHEEGKHVVRARGRRVDSSGDATWIRTLDEETGCADDEGKAVVLALDPWGDLLLAGSIGDRFAVAKLAGDGSDIVCGNGVVEGGEACDDGPDFDGGCCSPVCRISAPAPPDEITGPFFLRLCDLPGQSASSQATDVSADGSVVVGTSVGDRPGGCPFLSGECIDESIAFRWMRETGMVPLPAGCGGGAGTTCYANVFAVSADGSVLVGDDEASDCYFGARAWGQPEARLRGISSFFDVAADGTRLVGAIADCDYYPCDFRGPALWSESDGVELLDPLPGHKTGAARGVSADGTVVVGESCTNGGPDFCGGGFECSGDSEAFVWTQNAGLKSLNELPAPPAGPSMTSTGELFATAALAVSADGATIVGPTSSGDSYRWTAAEGLAEIGPAGARSVSADGAVVLGSDFLWDPVNGHRNLWRVLEDHFGLDFTGWRSLGATAISDDGATIVGSGWNPSHQLEAFAVFLGSVCNDGEDNDADGLTDYLSDPGCISPIDASEMPECSDGLDNDGDGLTDMPADPGCENLDDPGELTVVYACDDGLDNDEDGLVDLDDPGCPYPAGATESPSCDDGEDNDGNGLVDFDDPACTPEWPYWEQPPTCGLGGSELAAGLALFLAARRRRRR
jgi:cysteine-rich repeat protein